MAFSDRLKEARVAKKMNQEDLAKIIGVAKSTLSGWEIGTREPPCENILKLIRALDVDANFLFQDGMNEQKALSGDEKALLTTYRQLTQENQDKLIRIANGMLDMQAGEEILAKVSEAEESEGTA